jgi:hypothetical protein
MKIAVIHDYADVFQTTRAYQRLRGHEVVVHTDAYTEPARVVEQVAGCEAVLLTQQRVPMTREGGATSWSPTGSRIPGRGTEGRRDRRGSLGSGHRRAMLHGNQGIRGLLPAVHARREGSGPSFGSALTPASEIPCSHESRPRRDRSAACGRR